MVNNAEGQLSCGRKELLDANGNAIFWYVGDTRDQEFTFTNPDGTPVDLTGLIYNAILRRDLNEGSYIFFDKTMTLTDPVNGVVTLSIVAGELIESGRFLLEIYEDLGGGNKKTIGQYEIEVLESAL